MVSDREGWGLAHDLALTAVPLEVSVRFANGEGRAVGRWQGLGRDATGRYERDVTL